MHLFRLLTKRVTFNGALCTRRQRSCTRAANKGDEFANLRRLMATQAEHLGPSTPLMVPLGMWLEFRGAISAVT
jgi:hypothetical protein